MLKILALTLAFHTPLAHALADNEQMTIETRNTLWASFQAADRLPTATTAKRMTAEGLKSCNDWRVRVQKTFRDQINEISVCEKSDGVCASKKACASYWTTEVKFKNPLTLVTKTRAFTGAKSQQKMEACLKWTHEVARQEGARSLWSMCRFEDHFDETEPVVGEAQYLMDLSKEATSRLAKHHEAQARTPNVKFSQRASSTSDISFSFPAFNTHRPSGHPNDCNSWRKQSLIKFAEQITGIEPCWQAGTACNFSSLSNCSTSHMSRISWKVPRSSYVIQRKFLSQISATHALESCLRWLKDEQDFAPTETIDSKCVQSGEERNGGTTLYSTLGTLIQVDLE